MKTRIWVTGQGVVSGLGLNVYRHRQVASKTLPAVSPIDVAGLPLLPIDRRFSVNEFVKSSSLRRRQRLSLLVMAAMHDAWTDAGLNVATTANLDEMGVIVSTEYGPQRTVSEYLDKFIGGGMEHASPSLFTQTVYNAAAGQGSIFLKTRGVNSTLVGASAVAYAMRLLRAGDAEAILACGVDETNDIMTARLRTIYCAARLTSFILGEAAGALILETSDSCRLRKARPHAELLSFSSMSAGTAGLEYTQWPDDEPALEQAVRRALDDSALTMKDIDLIVAPANGFPGVDQSEKTCLDRLGWSGPIIRPRLIAGECFGGNEPLAYVLGLSCAEPKQVILIIVVTVSGDITATVVRKEFAHDNH
jgi:beta-ketoacyl synthase